MKRFFLCFLLLSSSIQAVQWDEANNPENFGAVEKGFLDLPFEGKIDFTWSDNYWATYQGGISYRWKKSCPFRSEVERYGYKIGELPQDLSCLSPAEKFDLIRGDKNWTLTRFERQRTQIMKTVPGSREYEKDFKIETWEGICHAWAPALLSYQTPKPILLTSPEGLVIPFGSSDIKALLSFGVHLADGELSPELRDNTLFAGKRCNLNIKKLKERLAKREITRAEYEKEINDPACGEDLNAGSFHIILTNMIGIRQTGFVIDKTPTSEVWNQPVLEYSSQVQPTDLFRLRRTATPGAQSQRRIKTKVKMIVEVGQDWNTTFHKESIKDFDLEYWIDLDYRGEIIGGEWISEARPDFVWANTKVSAFEGIMQLLEPIYTASVEQKELLINKLRIVAKKAARKVYLQKLTQTEFINLHSNLFKDKENFTKYLYLMVFNASEDPSELNLKEIKLWLRHGANVNARRAQDEENIILKTAIRLNNLELIKLLVEVGGANPSGTLNTAVNIGNLEVVKFLLEKGSSAIERTKGKFGTLPPLFAAALKNNLELLNLLFDHGAAEDINLTDYELETPLIYALRGTKDEPSLEGLKTIALLLKMGADPNIRNEKLYTALSIANKKTGRYAKEIEALLIKHGAKL
jgi:ankyrin repeat protein